MKYIQNLGYIRDRTIRRGFIDFRKKNNKKQEVYEPKFMEWGIINKNNFKDIDAEVS